MMISTPGVACWKNRKVIDDHEVKDFLRSVNMEVVNGRKGKDAFTCVSAGKGCSVVHGGPRGQSVLTSSTILEW